MSDVQRLRSKKKGIGVKTPQTLAILKGLPKKKKTPEKKKTRSIASLQSKVLRLMSDVQRPAFISPNTSDPPEHPHP